ncbi:MAG TPA: glucosaminidase domain-containing protein, partial [Chitinophagaceae bacterium]|nr:glucosaminidase domain-containing protein [Chitinophagaceae bacterium]
MKRTKLFLLFFLASGIMAFAQEKTIIQNYIEEYRELAIAEMQRTGVPAAIKLAQGIHETMAGTSPLVIKSNNHFGIKCKSNWSGASVSHDDDARGECFRKYPTALDSYRDHSNFLKGSQRYASLFQLDPMDYQAWAYGLKKAGYATNPRYPGIIIKLVEEYNLQDYTLIAMGKRQPGDWSLAKKQETAEPEKVEAIQAVLKTETPVIIQPAYPEGEFRINETRVIFARKGVSYLSLAQQYNISLARLFEFNDMRPSEMTAFDQLVYLQRKRKTGNEEFHVVKPGETLQSIAQVQAIRLESLQEYNYLKNDMQPAVG